MEMNGTLLIHHQNEQTWFYIERKTFQSMKKNYVCIVKIRQLNNIFNSMMTSFCSSTTVASKPSFFLSQESTANNINVLTAVQQLLLCAKGGNFPIKGAQHTHTECKYDCKYTAHVYTQYMALRHTAFLRCYHGWIPQRSTDSYLRLIYVFLAVLMSRFLLVMSNMRPGGGDRLQLLG